jgi:hypothetical protein
MDLERQKKQRERETDRQTKINSDGLRKTKKDEQRQTYRDRQTDRQTETVRQTDRD